MFCKFLTNPFLSTFPNCLLMLQIIVYIPICSWWYPKNIKKHQKTSQSRYIPNSSPGNPWKSPTSTCKNIWVNYHISLTWILRPFWDDSPTINHDSRARENSEVVICFTQIRCIETSPGHGWLPPHRPPRATWRHHPAHRRQGPGVMVIGWWFC